jgi:hypothetical protein
MGLGSEIRDPEKTYSGSRIQGSKKAPDPGSRSATLLTTLHFAGLWIRIRNTANDPVFCRVVDPDPHKFELLDPYPDPGGQK